MSAYQGKSPDKNPVEKLVEEMIAKGIVKARSPMLDRVAETMQYIIVQATARGVDLATVRCPDRREWTSLSTCHHPVLPSEAILRMRAQNDFLKFARLQYNGDLRQACFAIAQQHLRDLKAAQARP